VTWVTNVDSATVSVASGTAAQLPVTTQPSATAKSCVPSLHDALPIFRDASGNPVSQAGVTVTAAIATGGGTLGGTLTATTTETGVATFTNLAITGAAGDRTLSFSATGLTSVNSATVKISSAPACHPTAKT